MCLHTILVTYYESMWNNLDWIWISMNIKYSIFLTCLQYIFFIFKEIEMDSKWNNDVQ